jgi:glucose-6-phosphate 1-dehydrogenase
MPKKSNELQMATTATTSVPDQRIPTEACLIEQTPEPCSLVIIGASGDLTQRKLIPAIYHLFIKGALPDPFFIIGCSRTEISDQGFRDKIREALSEKNEIDMSQWTAFASSLHYRPVHYDDPASFKNFADHLKKLDKKLGTLGNRIFYLAIPPSLYTSTVRMLGKAGLSLGGNRGKGWARIVVEKPFGRDLTTAIDLDQALHQYFQEKQIFRIDHYLAKETVQNILMFRFANAIFEPIWNRRYINRVDITAAESLGVEHRAGYYEEAGVLRDMFQNHMMQLLALTAMDPPSRFEADRVRDEKVRVYRALRPFPIEKTEDYLILGQYGAGTVHGKRVPAYRDERGVKPDSLTPTFARMKLFLDNWRWQGVPFYLTSGKRLGDKMTQVSIQFKEVPHALFHDTLGDEIQANHLILGVYPDEKITLTFQTKNPGAKMCLRSVTMDFNYNQNYTGPVLDAYEKVLMDCMLGDQMLFWRQDGVELCWSFLTPILIECESCGNRAQNLLPYEAGSWGPVAFKGL